MFRKTIIVIVFTFAVGLVGCRSCWGPYDRCQPTFVPEAGDQCMGELYRNGSILGGMERRNGASGCATCGGGASSDYAEGAEMVSPVNHEELMSEELGYDDGAASGNIPLTAPASGGSSGQAPFHPQAEELPSRAITERPITPEPASLLPPDANLNVEEFPLSE